MDPWRRYVDVASSDPEDRTRRRLINILILGLVMATLAVSIAIPIASAFGAAGSPQEVRLLWISVCSALAGSFIVYATNRYVSGTLAGVLFVSLLLAIAIFTDTPHQVAKGRGLFIFALPILAGAIVIRPWVSFVTALCASAAVSAIAVIQANAEPDFPVLLGFFVLALLAYLSAEGFQRALRRSRAATESLQQALDGTIRSLGVTIELRDPYTAGHQRRTTALASAIAEEMQLPKEQVQGLQAASWAHDIGKIAIPAEILSKPTPLNASEYSMVKEHPRAGYEILKDVAFPWPIDEIVLQHHERLDGSGYPQGLTGDEIRLEARILAVADVVEAMAAHRPYRAAHGIDAALEEIRRGAGVAYDADVVVACVRLFESGRFEFEEPP